MFSGKGSEEVSGADRDVSSKFGCAEDLLEECEIMTSSEDEEVEIMKERARCGSSRENLEANSNLPSVDNNESSKHEKPLKQTKIVPPMKSKKSNGKLINVVGAGNQDNDAAIGSGLGLADGGIMGVFAELVTEDKKDRMPAAPVPKHDRIDKSSYKKLADRSEELGSADSALMDSKDVKVTSKRMCAPGSKTCNRNNGNNMPLFDIVNCDSIKTNNAIGKMSDDVTKKPVKQQTNDINTGRKENDGAGEVKTKVSDDPVHAQNDAAVDKNPCKSPLAKRSSARIAIKKSIDTVTLTSPPVVAMETSNKPDEPSETGRKTCKSLTKQRKSPRLTRDSISDNNDDMQPVDVGDSGRSESKDVAEMVEGSNLEDPKARRSTRIARKLDGASHDESPSEHSIASNMSCEERKSEPVKNCDIVQTSACVNENFGSEPAREVEEDGDVVINDKEEKTSPECPCSPENEDLISEHAQKCVNTCSDNGDRISSTSVEAGNNDCASSKHALKYESSCSNSESSLRSAAESGILHAHDEEYAVVATDTCEQSTSSSHAQNEVDHHAVVSNKSRKEYSPRTRKNSKKPSESSSKNNVSVSEHAQCHLGVKKDTKSRKTPSKNQCASLWDRGLVKPKCRRRKVISAPAWCQNLPIVKQGKNTSPKTSTGATLLKKQITADDVLRMMQLPMQLMRPISPIPDAIGLSDQTAELSQDDDEELMCAAVTITDFDKELFGDSSDSDDSSKVLPECSKDLVRQASGGFDVSDDG